MNLAIKYGYQVVEVYEAWHWDQQQDLFSDFMQLILRRKFMHSGFPKNLSTDEYQSFCDQINHDLKLPDELKLTVNDIKLDPQKKLFYKLVSVSLLGKLGQSAIFNQDFLINNSSDLEKYFFNKKGEIDDVELIDKFTLFMSFKPYKDCRQINRGGNCIISAMICANGRVEMYESLQTLLRNQCEVYSLEADSITFAMNQSETLPFPLGHSLGQFHEEYR